MSSAFRVLIAGGGVAALEAVLALRELAGDRVDVTVIAPADEFVYRPLRVREPFALAGARSYSLDDILRDLGAQRLPDSFQWLDAPARVLHTEQGQSLEYDALLLAMGARLHPAFTHALTIDDRILDDQLHGLVQDVEEGYVRSIVFLAPAPMPWPLPMYELALMTARRAYDMQAEVAITIVTPEDEPLGIFGAEVSRTVARLLDANGIVTIASARGAVPASGKVTIHPGERTLQASRIVALPQLHGPSTPGVPAGRAGGFIPIDRHCRVQGLENVFAAGDATDFPIKLGGIAAQQADTAAQAIAVLAGAPVAPTPFTPEIRAILLGADTPLYLSAQVSGAHGTRSQISESPLWSPPSKIVAKYLAPYLEAWDHQGHGAPAR